MLCSEKTSPPFARKARAKLCERILGHNPSSLQVTRRYVRLLDDD